MASSALETVCRIMAEADCLATAAEVELAYERMAVAIARRLGNANPLLYVVMKGGLVVAGQLLPRLAFPLEVDYLHATRYGDALKGQSAIEWHKRPSADCAGRSVLVIDDILDEGHTLAAIRAELHALGAAEVLTAVLVHKSHERKAVPGMRADFTGLEIADRFLFGCGMDYCGYWRNAPGIYAVKGLQT